MILNIFREDVERKSNELNLINENDSVEIQKIKGLLDVSSLDYISNSLRYILGIQKENKVDCFTKTKNEYRVVGKNNSFRVILYIRLSVEDGDIIDGDVSKSIRNQLLYLLSECKQRSWEVVAIFCEEGISGADDNRPEWLKALKYCECGNTEIFLCKSQSRFSRSMEMIERYLHKEFVFWNIRFVGLVDNTDTAVQGNKKTRQISGLVNEWQVEDQSINTRKVLRNKKLNGLCTASFAPYGYIKDPDDKYKLKIDEPAAKIVREIFDMYVNGKGYGLICKYLNDKRVPTPAQYKKIQGSKYYTAASNMNKRITYKVEENESLEEIAIRLHSKVPDIMEYNNLSSDKVVKDQIIIVPVVISWSKDTIRKILRDETYIGTLVQGKVEGKSYKDKSQRRIPEKDWIKVPHCHKAIIDKATWQIVSSRFKDRGRKKTTKNGEMHIFGKKVYCACCEKTFQKNTAHVKKGKQDYMLCGGRKKSAGITCDNTKAVKYDELESIIKDEINKQIKKYYDYNKVEKNYYLKKLDNEVNNNIKILNDEIFVLATQIEKKRKALTLLYEDRVNEVISVTEFTMIKNQYTVEIDEFNKRISQINHEIETLESSKTIKQDNEKILKKYKKIEKLNNIIIDEFIDKIIIGKVDPITQKRKMHIIWNISIE